MTKTQTTQYPLKLWKKPMKLHRRLKQLGYKPPFQFIKMNSWKNAASPLASYAMPNQWFADLGLVNLGHIKTGYVFAIILNGSIHEPYTRSVRTVL